jgi:subtilisin family serine protease
VQSRKIAVVVVVVGLVVAGTGVPAYADEVRDGQRQLAELQVEEAHQHSLGDGVTVAVLDSGVDASHPDLRGNVLPGIDLTDRGSDGRDDPTGSGTVLAGLVAGHGHGERAGDGVLGLAPAAVILPVVVAPPGAAPAAGTLAAGIDEAARRGAGVICIGAPVPDDPAVSRALGTAVAAGAVVVVPGVPAGDALGRYGGAGLLGAVPSPSLTGGQGVVAVPAAGALSTGGQGGYYLHARATQAAAAGLLAGAVALVRAAHPGLAAHELTHRLAQTTDRGELDLVAALTEAVEPPADPPPPPPPPAAGTAAPSEPPEPPDPTTQVAAFDSDDWHRWLVGAPLLAFLVVLVGLSVAGARRARRSPR